MLQFSFDDKALTGAPVLIPLYRDILTDQRPALLKGLTSAQKDAVLYALKKNAVASSGVTAVATSRVPVLVYVLGSKASTSTRDCRDAGGSLAGIASKFNVPKLSVAPGSLSKAGLRAFREGVILSGYQFTAWKGVAYKKSQKGKKILKNVCFIGSEEKGESKYLKAMDQGVTLTKDLINTPPQTATPSYLEKVAKELAKQPKVTLTALREKELTKLGCQGILTVGRGSHEQSRLLILKYSGGKSEKPIALVGKGVTFDTGGLSIKPAQYMLSMKQDLGGAATMLGAFKAAVALGIKKNIMCVIPTVENTINSHAYKPDDVIKMYSGLTVEVTNTDAEGRLILGDALAYTCEKFKPRVMFDAATLTGACYYAVGNDICAYMTDDTKVAKGIEKSGEDTDEPIWRLPLHKEYKKRMTSPVADIYNYTDKIRAGTTQAGLFLQHFVDDKTPWCHLDIASVAFDSGSQLATGRTVRTLVDFIEKW